MKAHHKDDLTLLLDEYITDGFPPKLRGKSEQLERMRIQRFIDFMLNAWYPEMSPDIIERWLHHMSRGIIRRGTVQQRQLEAYRSAVTKFYQWTLTRPSECSMEQIYLSSSLTESAWPRARKYIGKKGIRPYRDKAILIMIQSMEVSIPQLIAMNLEDLQPNDAYALKNESPAFISVKGSVRCNHRLSQKLVQALVDYIEQERYRDVTDQSCSPLFLNSIEIPNRNPSGRMSIGNVYRICRKLGNIQ